MNSPQPLEFVNFDSDLNPLAEIARRLGSPQSLYLCKYLSNIGARTVLIEPSYFDRDYLSEFSAFYCVSAKGYPNVCARLHFFSSDKVDRDFFKSVVSGDAEKLTELQSSYIGFTVLRPITQSPFGRTVLRWYPDKTPDTPRVVEPSRFYTCNVAGVELRVKGLAWQQQDSGVAACATIGIWSILHSSAFDARHAIPTTAMITEAAHSSALTGRPPYPSHYLAVDQIKHAIIQLGFNPAFSSGELQDGFFSKDRFANTCAAYLRSGYPLLIGGIHGDGVAIGHAICAVGFRETPPLAPPHQNQVVMQDSDIEYIYIHDDNIGPNVRFKVTSEPYANGLERCVLRMESPDYLQGYENAQLDNTTIIPRSIVAAVHQDLKVTSDLFFQAGINLTTELKNALNAFLGDGDTSLVFSTRFIMVKDYLSSELGRALCDSPNLLGDVRMKLQEDVPPMSMHLAVLRIALPDASLMMDVLYDTTDTDKNRHVFCHITFDSVFSEFLSHLDQGIVNRVLGQEISAYEKE